MSAVATATAEPLDSTTLQAILIRWKLAEQFLLTQSDEAGKMAIHVLISSDLPVLFRELLRLRSDLTPISPGK
jgi:hypothetical protein